MLTGKHFTQANSRREPNLKRSRSAFQWTQQPSASSVNVLYPPALLSPGHYPSGATYSFTADFRPPIQNQSQMNSIIDPNKMSPPAQQRSAFYPNNSLTYSPPRSPSSLPSSQTILRNAKNSLGLNFEDEDSNDCIQSESKPNLCRLCGKTYARPSTLKTHLRYKNQLEKGTNRLPKVYF